MRRVLLGGDGVLRGGRSERSIERFDRRRGLGEVPVDVGGVDSSIGMGAAAAICVVV